jgi:signal transduction histidine kinase
MSAGQNHAVRLPGLVGRPTGRLRRALGRILVLLTAAGWATAWVWPGLQATPSVAVANVVVASSLAMSAVLLYGENVPRRVTVCLLLCALFWPINTSTGWDIGPGPFLRTTFEGFFWLSLGLCIFAYQHVELGRLERVWFTCGATQWIGVNLLWATVSEPEWAGYPEQAWWPVLWPDRQLNDVINSVILWANPVLALTYILLLLYRQRRASGLDRYALVPVYAAIAVATLTAGISYAAYGRTTGLGTVVLLLIPLGFIAQPMRRRLIQAQLGEALAQLAGEHPEMSVVDALRSVLRDPTLWIAYWAPDRQHWMDTQGRPLDVAATASERLVVPVKTSDGERLALVCTAPTSLGNRTVVESAVRASGLSLENSRLHAVVQAQMRALVEVGVRERRRLERDLHDGAQQSLLAGLAAAERARLQLPEKGAGEAYVALATVRERLTEALGQLRDLAHGLYPAALTRGGLAAAIGQVGERLPINVDLDVASTRLSGETEATVYYVVCEAMTNIAKHADATRARVEVTLHQDRLNINITDNGQGGATLSGTGVSGMAQRIQAFGGQLHLSSPIGGGTQIQAWLPCA